MRKNRYAALKFRLVLRLLAGGYLTPKKLINLLACYLRYVLRSERSGRLPFIINFELWNECNLDCLFCRSDSGAIFDQNPAGSGEIAKGQLPFETFSRVIDETGDRLLLAVLYITGEPLLYQRLDEAIRYADRRRVATLLSTNGLLLDRERGRRLLDSGLTCIKIAMSGFADATYNANKQRRRGDVARIKANIEALCEEKRLRRAPLIVMLDFMLYDYNRHEVEEVQTFCDRLGIVFNLRPGKITFDDYGAYASAADAGGEPGLCDWPWKILSLNWDGAVYPCCDYVFWSGQAPYACLTPQAPGIAAIWNGADARAYRRTHVHSGRKAIPVCAGCTRKGIAFRY